MNKTVLIIFLSLSIACNSGKKNRSDDDVVNLNDSGREDVNNNDGPDSENSVTPSIVSEATYPVLEDLEITFAEALVHKSIE